MGRCPKLDSGDFWGDFDFDHPEPRQELQSGDRLMLDHTIDAWELPCTSTPDATNTFMVQQDDEGFYALMTLPQEGSYHVCWCPCEETTSNVNSCCTNTGSYDFWTQDGVQFEVRAHVIVFQGVFSMGLDLGMEVESAARLAVDMINDNPAVLNGVQINWQIANVDSCNAKDAIMQTFQSFSPDCPVIIGGHCSQVAESMALITSISETVHISGAATTPTLSDPNKYPYFFRTVASDTVTAQYIVTMCRQYGWNHLALLNTKDDWGKQVSESIRDALTVAGIQILTHQEFLSVKF